MSQYLHSLWKKSKNISTLFFYEKIFFYFLCFLELFYRGAFYCTHLYRKKGAYLSKTFPFKIFSVGNLSAGGTGKSVFSRFLVDSISSYRGAIVLRGYRGENEKKGTSFLVSDGENIVGSVSLAGDEAYMLARAVSASVVVGRDRDASCELLNSASVEKIDYAVLDDGYQNCSLKKDLDLVLLDARKPFENGHCFPAGRLREKDLSRADVIVLTHADSIHSSVLDDLKKMVEKKHPNIPIFAGKHTLVSIFDSLNHRVSRKNIIEKNFVACAGIASFSSFTETLKKDGLSFSHEVIFEDHHSYSFDDIVKLAKIVNDGGYDAIITTAKDWYKIEPLLVKLSASDRFSVFWLDVTFAFLTAREHACFFKLLERLLEK